MTNTDLLKLRNALAKATGPSIELDDALWLMQTGLPAYTEGEPFKAGNPPRRTRLSIPRFTASIDAAETLEVAGIQEVVVRKYLHGVYVRWTMQDLLPRVVYGNDPNSLAPTEAIGRCMARINYEISKAHEAAEDESGPRSKARDV
jgi:hypothetical protein